jgi:hypothetical protein
MVAGVLSVVARENAQRRLLGRLKSGHPVDTDTVWCLREAEAASRRHSRLHQLSHQQQVPLAECLRCYMAGLRGGGLHYALPDDVRLPGAECSAVCSSFPLVCIGVLFALLLECAALDGVLNSNCSSRTHLAFLRFLVPFARQRNCFVIDGMGSDTTKTKNTHSAIKTSAASG